MKTLIFTPTYNEADNIKPLADAIFSINPDYHFLVVDDHSPDGTYQIVEHLQNTYPHLLLIDRSPPRGRGLAGKDGFCYALHNDYDVVVEMDADLSHDPAHLESLIAGLENADVVIGSRYIQGGSDTERNVIRKTISYLSGVYIRKALDTSIQDCTSGYRVFSKNALKKIEPQTLAATGPETVEEILYRCLKANVAIVEIPIQFQDRGTGESKLRLPTLLNILYKIAKLRFTGSV